jgi:hypothetical protein
LGLLEKIFGHKFEDIIEIRENYKKKRFLMRAISNYLFAKPKRTKWLSFELHILEMRRPFEALARRPWWGRSRKACCDCITILE